jgi:hypothetical protein
MQAIINVSDARTFLGLEVFMMTMKSNIHVIKYTSFKHDENSKTRHTSITYSAYQSYETENNSHNIVITLVIE